MNYLLLINNFWRLDLEYSFSPLEIATYFRLVARCNALGWKNPFNYAVAKMLLELKLKTKDPLDSSRNRLKQVGLIDFKNGNGRGNATIYTLKEPGKDIDIPPPLSPVSPPFSPTKSPHNNKDKLKETNYNYIYYVGNQIFNSIKDFLEKNYQLKMRDLAAKYGSEVYEKAIIEFSSHNNEKIWKDGADVSQHFSSFIRKLSDSISAQKEKKILASKKAASSLKDSIIESTKTILNELENGQNNEFENYD